MQEKHIDKIITEIFSEPTKILPLKKEPRKSEDNGKPLTKLQWLLLSPKAKVLLAPKPSTTSKMVRINSVQPETLAPTTLAFSTQMTRWSLNLEKGTYIQTNKQTHIDTYIHACIRR